jgi:hypothetical protein
MLVNAYHISCSCDGRLTYSILDSDYSNINSNDLVSKQDASYCNENLKAMNRPCGGNGGVGTPWLPPVLGPTFKSGTRANSGTERRLSCRVIYDAFVKLVSFILTIHCRRKSLLRSLLNFLYFPPRMLSNDTSRPAFNANSHESSLISNGYRGVKRPRRETDDSSPSSAEVKNG